MRYTMPLIIMIFIAASNFSHAHHSPPTAKINEQDKAIIHHHIISSIRSSESFKQVAQSCQKLEKEDIHPVHCATLADAPYDLHVSFGQVHIIDKTENIIIALAVFIIESGNGNHNNYLFALSKQSDGQFKIIDSLDLKNSSRCISNIEINNNTIVIPLLQYTGGAGGQCVPLHQSPSKFIVRDGKLLPLAISNSSTP